MTALPTTPERHHGPFGTSNCTHLRCGHELRGAGGDFVGAHHQFLKLSFALHHQVSCISAQATSTSQEGGQAHCLPVGEQRCLHHDCGPPAHRLGRGDQALGPAGVLGIKLLHGGCPLDKIVPLEMQSEALSLFQLRVFISL